MLYELQVTGLRLASPTSDERDQRRATGMRAVPCRRLSTRASLVSADFAVCADPLLVESAGTEIYADGGSSGCTYGP